MDIAMGGSALTQVSVETDEGTVVLGIDEARAPLTAANFLAYVDSGFLKDATIYRSVTQPIKRSALGIRSR